MTGNARSKVLVVTADRLSDRMAGPAIRAFAMARELAKHADVQLVSTLYSSLPDQPGFPIHDLSGAGFEAYADWADVIVFQGHLLDSHPWVAEKPARLVADLYDPMHLEVLEQDRDEETELRDYRLVHTAEVLNLQMEVADFMVCASDKQRDFWLGALATLGRVNHVSYDADPSLRSLLDVVPFGIDDEPPVQRRHALKGTVPGIGVDDRVIIWGGGVYNWFDPLTLIRAVDRVADTHPDLRLFFLGGQHPNPNVPTMQMLTAAHDLAGELGLRDRVVFFNAEWAPYDERADYLLDADIGVSTHFDHIETAFSFRTRMLDYLWAGLPMISTTGDTFADLIREEGLGEVVPPDDVDALADAITRLLDDAEHRAAAREAVARSAQRYRWSEVLRPLVRYCADPRPAADLAAAVHLPMAVRTDKLQHRIDGLERSMSWRLTRPLRAVTGLVRRATGRVDPHMAEVEAATARLHRDRESRR